MRFIIPLLCAGALIATGCVPGVGGSNIRSSASEQANAQADASAYKPVQYANADIPGGQIIVLPGRIKSNTPVFNQKISPSNIADFAEIEMSNANFRVLERADLGPILQEFELAYNLGDARKARKLLRRGRAKSTNQIVRFDVIKAEMSGQAGNTFDGRSLGAILGAVVGNQSLGTEVGGSVKQGETAGVWTIGIRYKVLNAETTEQVFTGYIEDRLEVGGSSSQFLGVGSQRSGGFTLDSAVQRLVQKAVAEIDAKKGRVAARKAKTYGGLTRDTIRKYQAALNSQGYNTGIPDGIPGKKTSTAIKQFQKDVELPVTGKLDKTVIKKLDLLIGQ